MVLIVEDGTIVANANSFVDVATADIWFASMNNADWAALDTPTKEANLIVGAGYVCNAQIYPYSGEREDVTQWMCWPRENAGYWNGGPSIPTATIPNEVTRANMVAAGLNMDGGLPTASPQREVKRERVDVIQVEYFHSSTGYSTVGADAYGPNVIAKFGHPDVTGLLMPLLRADAVTDGDSGGVARTDAARRGAVYRPDGKPNAFVRGQFDTRPFAEDLISEERAKP